MVYNLMGRFPLVVIMKGISGWGRRVRQERLEGRQVF